MAGSRNPSHPVQVYRLPSRDLPIALDEGPDCVVALRALGEETRVRIMGLLIGAPLDVNEIARQVGASQYNVSKHLRILREAGLLQVEKRGRRHVYALRDGIRRRVSAQSVLDLGCCSFTFDRPAPGSGEAPVERRPRRSAARSR